MALDRKPDWDVASRPRPHERSRWRGWIGLLAFAQAVSLWSWVPLPSQAQTRGYQARACGFDLDDDGVIGERNDDCRICDAPVSAGIVGTGTRDPDGDGVLEDLIYVDCDRGSDRLGCGREGAPPCRTLQYAFDGTDGAGDGAEDVLCFRGTCNPHNLHPPKGVGGVPGTHTKPPVGNAVRSWEFPSDPAMVVGWDADRDGAYPPHDADDKALLYGGPPHNHNRAIALSPGHHDNDYFELAHFSVSEYGNLQSAGNDSGFLHPNDTSFLYLHDLEVDAINRDRCTSGCSSGGSGRIVINMFRSRGMRYFAIVNSSFTNSGGFWMRGDGGGANPGAGPIRVQNITWTAHGEDRARGPNVVKLWGHFSGLEFLDSVLDANVAAWNNVDTVNGIVMAQCARDFDVVSNEFIDLRFAVEMQGNSAGFCDGADARTVDGLNFARNLVRNDHNYTAPYRDFIGVAMSSGGADPGETTEDILVADNVFLCSTDCQSCFFYDMTYSGPSQPGRISFVRNVCDLVPGDRGFASFHISRRAPTRYATIELLGNSFRGASSRGLLVKTEYPPSHWTAEGNCYDERGAFVWGGRGPLRFGKWRMASGSDQNSLSATRCPSVLSEPPLAP